MKTLSENTLSMKFNEGKYKSPRKIFRNEYFPIFQKGQQLLHYFFQNFVEKRIEVFRITIQEITIIV